MRSGFENRTAFAKHMGRRLFHIHVLVGSQRTYGHRRMPMVWGRYDYRVDGPIVQQPAKISMRLRPLSLVLFDRLDGACQVVLMNVANGDDFRRRMGSRKAHQVAAAATGADDANRETIICAALRSVRLPSLAG
jgi:hypothetical protein